MKLLISSLICFCSLSFGQVLIGTSQGYVFFDSGAVFSVRSFFPSVEYAPMYQPPGIYNTGKKIVSRGSNYYIDESGTLTTFDQRGDAVEEMDFLYKNKVRKSAGSYFITKNSEVNIVMTDGSIQTADTTDVPQVKRAKALGGLFMVTRKSELLTVSPYDAQIIDLTSRFAHKVKDIVHIGHNYMITEDGTLYTIGFKEVSDQMVPVVKASNTRASRTAKIIGGNYFFDSKNNLHTIDFKGELDKGDYENTSKLVIPSIGKDKSKQRPVTMGNNYFIYDDGEVYTVDAWGDFYYLRTLEQFERVAQTNFVLND